MIASFFLGGGGGEFAINFNWMYKKPVASDTYAAPGWCIVPWLPILLDQGKLEAGTFKKQNSGQFSGVIIINYPFGESNNANVR